MTDKTDRLIGPFTVELSGTNSYEIVGGDGTVAIWVLGESNARRVAEALNRSYEESELN